jgi:hypothetical protein
VRPRLPRRLVAPAAVVLVLTAAVGAHVVTRTPDGMPVVAAVSACGDATLDRLRDPDSATFGSDYTVELSDEDVWSVQGTVRSRNGFGGMVGSTFLCTAVDSGGEWIAFAVLGEDFDE